ncbi:MAG: DUF2505 domain-containing protein [Bifidobacteriaceae bacterium]|jgi:hypothetical protein|nr:DUF2505 domain-containing protein [Bifidobacteriaceae bacterium]
MRFAAHYDYTVPPTRLSELLTDRDFLVESALAAGAESASAELLDSPDSNHTVLIRSAIPPDQFPATVKAFLPQGLELRQALVWEAPDDDGSRQALISGEIAGAPVELHGLVLLRPTPDGSRAEFSGEVESQIPLVGRAVEEAALPVVLKALDAQHQVAQEWLERPGAGA